MRTASGEKNIILAVPRANRVVCEVKLATIQRTYGSGADGLEFI